MDGGKDGDLALAAAGALGDLTAAADRIRDAVSDHLGVDRSAVAALSRLAGDRPVGAVELAAELDLSASSVTSLVDRLAAAGLAERVPHPTDRRKRVIVLTERGTAAVEWLADLRRAVFADIAAGDLPTLAETISRLAAQLDRQVSRLRTDASAPLR